MSFLLILMFALGSVYTKALIRIPHISVSGRGKHIFHAISTSDGRWGSILPECSSPTPFPFPKVSCYYWSSRSGWRHGIRAYPPPWPACHILRMRLRSLFFLPTPGSFCSSSISEGTTPLKSSISIFAIPTRCLALLFG